MPAFSEISGEWKATSSSRNERPRTPPMNSGMRPFMYSLWSSSAAVTPPTLASMPEPLRLAGDDVVAQAVDEVLRLLVLRRGRRDHGDERRVAGPVDPGTVRRTRPRARWRSRSANAVDVGPSRRAGRELGGDHERAVGAGAEPLGVEVVGLPGHRVGRVVAGVGEAETHAERGRGEREQERRGGDRASPGPALDRVAPARRGRVRVCPRP